MIISKLDKQSYAGKEFVVRYTTNGYYDIKRNDSGFQISYKAFDTPVEKSFTDHFFSEWLEDPVAYGVFEDGELIGIVEGTPEAWNNRYRISNICIFDDTRLHCGIGAKLMDTILDEAKKSGARMVVLELKPRRELASIWRAAVAKGTGLGFRASDLSILSTVNLAPFKVSRRFLAVSSVRVV